MGAGVGAGLGTGVGSGVGSGEGSGVGSGEPAGGPVGAGAPEGAGEGTKKPQSQQTAVELKSAPTEGSQLSAGKMRGLSVVPLGRSSNWYSHSVKHMSSLSTRNEVGGAVRPHLGRVQGKRVWGVGCACVARGAASGSVRMAACACLQGKVSGERSP